MVFKNSNWCGLSMAIANFWMVCVNFWSVWFGLVKMVLLVTTDINIGCPKFQLIWTEYDMYMVFGDLRCLLVFSTGFWCSRLVLGVLPWFWVFLPGFWCSRLVLGVLPWFLVLLPGFGCSHLALGVLTWFWVFLPGFWCSRLVLGCFGCSHLVLGVFNWFWVFLPGFGCSWLVLGVWNRNPSSILTGFFLARITGWMYPRHTNCKDWIFRT